MTGLVEQYQWMSADRRINYLRTGRGWGFIARSPNRGGRESDRDHIPWTRSRTHPVFATRARAIEAMSATFSEHPDPPTTAIRRQPINKLVDGLEGFGVQRSSDGRWRLRLQGGVWGGNPTIHRMRCASKGVYSALGRLNEEWNELSGERFATVAEALDALRGWVASNGLDLDDPDRL